ncbi:MAG: putative quinol monooxygenase [Candidatus Hermodarchaeota archaeon]
MIFIPVSIIATVRVKEGKMEEAKKVLKQIVPKIKDSEPGTLEYIPHIVKQDPNVIIFYEKYSDSDALKGHTKSLEKNMAAFMPLLEPGMDIKYLEEII